jgi:hypothetical protein
LAGLQLGKTAAVAAQSGDNQANGEEGRPNAKTILAPLDQPEAVVDVDGPAIKVAMHGPGDSERHQGRVRNSALWVESSSTSSGTARSVPACDAVLTLPTTLGDAWRVW